MKTGTIIWAIVLVLAGGYLLQRAVISTQGMSKAYVKATPKMLIEITAPPREGAPADEQRPKIWVSADAPEAAGVKLDDPNTRRIAWDELEVATKHDYEKAGRDNPGQKAFQFSMSRTIGTWVAALLTLFIFSILYRDNPLYKIAESLFIGVSAAYWMVTGFWTVIVPNLIGRVSPWTVKNWALPGLSEKDLIPSYSYIVPLALGVMLIWRLSPKGGWISRWPLALFIGVFSGLRLVQFLHADFLNQIKNGIVPLYATTAGSFDWWQSLQNLIMLLGVLCCITYFFFSIEHRGFVGKVSRVGIWVLMITFGAMFGYTVMGRIALLAARLEFLFDDWLWLIDPTKKRLVADLATAAISAMGLG